MCTPGLGSLKFDFRIWCELWGIWAGFFVCLFEGGLFWFGLVVFVF